MAEPLVVSAALGLASNVSDLMRPTNKAKFLNNVNQSKRGVVTSRRRGWTRHRNSSFNGGARFLGFAEFLTSSTGVRTICFQVGSVLMSYNPATQTETNIATGLNSTALPTMHMFQPYASGASYMVWCNGVDQPRKVTSVSASSALQLNGGNYPQALTAPMPTKTYTKPKFCLPFLDRMLIWGFDGSDIAHDILITNAGTGETVTQGSPAVATDGDLRQLPPRLGKPTGGFAFSLSNDSLEQIAILGCERGIAILTGTDATNFSIKILTTQYGIPSNHTWIRIYNDVWFLTNQGISSYSTLASNTAPANNILTREVQDLLARINPVHAAKAHAFHHELYQDIGFWFPIDADTECKNALIGNYNNDLTQPGSPVPIWFTKDGTTVCGSHYFDGTVFGGGETGLLQVHYSGSKYDTTPVLWEIGLPFLGASNPLVGFDNYKTAIICEGPAQAFVVDCYQYEMMRDGKTKRILTNPQSKHVSSGDSGSLTYLDSWRSDASAFPSDQVKIIDIFAPKGNCKFAEYVLRGESETDEIDFVQLVAQVERSGMRQ